jgi:hypothetical protein
MQIEAQKYQKVWDYPKYRDWSPGDICVDEFIKQAKPRATDTIIDYGCGTGRAALRLSAYANVRMLDFTDNCLDEEVRNSLGDNLTFEQHDITKPINGEIAKFGFCTDVMEHIPEHQVKDVLRNIVTSSRYVFFQICNKEDSLGQFIGEQLHLTVKPYEWWKEQLEQVGCNIIDGLEHEIFCTFCVSAWASGSDVKARSSVNTEDEQIKANILKNLELGFPEAHPFEAQTQELIILAGGPSINDYVDEIRLNKMFGIPVVTVNGAYNWAIEHGIKPDLQIVLDARAFNKRFVEPIIPSCHYLIASQCDPDLVKSIPREQITLWHCGSAEAIKEAVAEFTEQTGKEHEVYPVYGGMTVMLRAFQLLLMLGFSRYAVYGFDSCLIDDKHHGYAQPENDGNEVIRVKCGDREFKCEGWMVTQAHEYVELQSMISEFVEMDIKGDGLIAHIIKTGAELAQEMV